MKSHKVPNSKVKEDTWSVLISLKNVHCFLNQKGGPVTFPFTEKKLNPILTPLPSQNSLYLNKISFKVINY